MAKKTKPEAKKTDSKVELPSKLLWVDLEMTGLDPQKDKIVEVAAIVTDFDFNELAQFDEVVHQTPAVLKKANSWVKEQHGASGLLDRVATEGKPEKDVEKDLVTFIKGHFDEPAVLAGNSIHQDRRFIRRYWLEVEKLLHYRMLDVTSWKIVMETKYEAAFTKQEEHRALNDIRESINELKFYIDWLQTKHDSKAA